MKIIAALALTLFCKLSFAAVILEVDLSDPSSAIFTPTAAVSDANYGPESVFNGLTLIDFFSGNTTVIDYDLVDSGSIDVFDSADASSRFQLTEVFIGSYLGGWTTNDMSFFENVTPADLYFFKGQFALSGGATFDLSSVQGLAAIGTIGNLIIGEPDSNAVVGQWQVVGSSTPVPTPATLALLGAGLIAFGYLKLKRKKIWHLFLLASQEH